MIVNGNRIRELREQRDLTLNRLAEKAGISISYLSEIERGSKKPSLKTLEKLAQALNLPRNQLLDSPASLALSPGEKLRLLREEKGMSLTRLAEMVGLSVSYLSEIECGRVCPSVDTLKKMAEGLGASLSAVLGEVRGLGQRLRSLREEVGLTQSELAGQAGLSAALIGQIEHGRVQPSLKTVEKLARVLGVSPCYFISDDAGIEQMVSLLDPQVREILADPNVQAVLRQICTLNQEEVRFVINFINLFKRSNLR